MRFFALLFLAPTAAFAQEIPLSFQGVKLVYARILSSYETAYGCDDFYLSGAIVQVPRVSRKEAESLVVEPGGRRVVLTSGISHLSKDCPLLPEKRVLTISSPTFILYAVGGRVNVTLDLPDGYWVETQAFPLEPSS